jgi:hypothetical protein
MSTESTFKTWLAGRLRDEGAYARRLEDQYAVGIPDMLIILPGGPVIFAEVKLIKRGKAWGPSIRQKIELDRISSMKAAISIMIAYDPVNNDIHLDRVAENLTLPGLVSFPRTKTKEYLPYIRKLLDMTRDA